MLDDNACLYVLCRPSSFSVTSVVREKVPQERVNHEEGQILLDFLIFLLFL